jgi:hypothetical protein
MKMRSSKVLLRYGKMKGKKLKTKIRNKVKTFDVQKVKDNVSSVAKKIKITL